MPKKPRVMIAKGEETLAGVLKVRLEPAGFAAVNSRGSQRVFKAIFGKAGHHPAQCYVTKIKMH